MIKKNIIFIFSFVLFFSLNGCKTVSQKIDSTTLKEEQELTKWLNKSEAELKINFGKPDRIEFLNSSNRNYIYISKKFKIVCERKFEINQNDVVIGYSSKNCF